MGERVKIHKLLSVKLRLGAHTFHTRSKIHTHTLAQHTEMYITGCSFLGGIPYDCIKATQKSQNMKRDVGREKVEKQIRQVSFNFVETHHATSKQLSNQSLI
jgi:hypothetical protein